MRCYLIYFSLILFSVSLSGQIADYKISEYKYQDVKRTFLEISPDIEINKNNDFSDRRLRANAGLWIDFNTRQYSEKIQFTGGAKMSSSFSLIEDDRFSDYKYRGFIGFLTSSIYYYPKGKWFIGGSTFTRSINFLRISEEERGRTNLFYTDTTPWIGYGRIEFVTDMWHAGAILEILETKGLLLKSLNRGDIEEFARIISEAKNIRNLDLRLESIDELELVYNYLVESGISKNEPLTAFLLKDAYDFEAFVSRQHGSRISVYPELQYSSRKRATNSIELQNDLETTYGFGITYRNNNAKSKLIQFNQSYTVKWLNNSINSFDVEEEAVKSFTFSTSHSLGLYVSQRTYFNAALRISYQEWREEMSVNGPIDNYASISGSWSAFYYMSPRTRFSATYQIGLVGTNKDEFENDKGINSDFNLGFQYFIF